MLLTCRYCGATCKEGGPIFHESKCVAEFFSKTLPEYQQVEDRVAKDEKLSSHDKSVLRDYLRHRFLGK